MNLSQNVYTSVFCQETSKETEGLKTQVADLREKVRSLRDEIEEQELNHKEKEESLRKTITALEVGEKSFLIVKNKACCLFCI